jgi:hypothetical protein
VLNAARKNADAATTRASDIDVLSAKLSSLSEQAKGQRSEQLAATAKLLASLSKPRSLDDELKFLSGFVKTVQDDLKQAKKDAEAAAQQAKKKANEADKKARKAATQPTTKRSN